MAWSTQRLADLAGTTVKAIRYYHRIGLLDEPERSANGYHKRYEVPHLIRLLQIKRLTDLGIPLSELHSLGPVGEDPDQALAALDAHLETMVSRINEVRGELAAIRRHRGSAYLPTEFAAISDDFSDRQRALLMAYSAVLGKKSLEKFRELIAEPTEIDREFEAFPADSDDAAIDDLVARMLPSLRESREREPWSKTPGADAPLGSEQAGQTMGTAMVQLYNPAQLQVLKRLNRLLTQQESAH